MFMNWRRSKPSVARSFRRWPSYSPYTAFSRRRLGPASTAGRTGAIMNEHCKATLGPCILARNLDHSFHRRVNRPEVWEAAGRDIGHADVIPGLDEPRLERLGRERCGCDNAVLGF